MGNPADLERARQGKEVWNKWAEENPHAEVDFSGQTLSLNFDGFVFPGDANFRDVKFNIMAQFQFARFLKDANFNGAEFRGYTSFIGTEFHQRALFVDTQFSKSAWFEKVRFTGRADFRNATFFHISMHEAFFERSVSFEDAKLRSASFPFVTFSSTPNFVGAKMDAAPSFQGVTFSFIDDDPKTNYAIRLRSLKALAIEGADHEMEVIFFAQEMRAKRRYELKGRPFERAWNFLYELLSFYGTSIFRPSLGLLFVYIVFFKFYLLVPAQYCQTKLPYLLYLSLVNLVPIPSGWKSSQVTIASCLYGSADQVPWSMMFLTTIEGLFGAIFLFLILLGIRNKFKIK